MSKPKKAAKGPDEVSKLDVVIPEEGEGFPATIGRIEMTTAGKVYGDKAKEPDKSVALLWFEGNGIEGKKAMSYSRIPNARSDLFKFMKRYRDAPHVGQEVQVAQDEDGFWRLVIE